MSVGDDQHDVLRVVIALVAVAIIAVAIFISKKREVTIGDDSTPAPPVGASGGSTAVTAAQPQHQQQSQPQAFVPDAPQPAAEPAPTQRFPTPPQ